MNQPPRIILITGASAGIGRAIVNRLATREDLHVVATARAASLPRLTEAGITESERRWIRPLDITNAEEKTALISEIDEKLGGVDILINNAGITYRAVVEHVSEEERMHQLGVNFRGPMELTRHCQPMMRKKRSGKIINVSSVGGMMAMPTMAVYNASKFALEGASEALYYEVKPWNIQVCLLQLGFINSDAFLKVPYTELGDRAAGNPDDPYHAHYQFMSRFIGSWMRRSLTQPEDVARRMERLIDRRKLPVRVRGTMDAVAFDLMRRVVPARIYNHILYAALPGIRKWGPNDQKP